MLVEEFAGRLAIEGVDANYTSAHVQRGSLLALPFPDGRFARALCLDVLEHLAYEDQPKALAELHRVLAPGGELLVSVPNLAHLQSRVHFLLTGRLIRTASEVKHPGDRPLAEYRRLFDRAGFDVLAEHGVFPTVPILTAWIRRKPADRAWLHTALTRLLPWPSLSFLAIVTLRRRRSRPRDSAGTQRPPAYTAAVLDRLRSLGKSFTVYGLGDVATSVISFLLLPLYARFLTPEDYGAIGLLLSVEVVAKIVFRFGLDAAFMRLYFDCPDDRARQRLASTHVLVPGRGRRRRAGALPGRPAAAGVGDGPRRLSRRAAHHAGQHVHHRLLLHPVPRPADDGSADDVRGPDDQPIGGDAADALRADHRLRPRRDRLRAGRPDRVGRLHDRHAALVRAADPAWCSRAPCSRTRCASACRACRTALLQQVMFVADRYVLRVFSVLGEVGLYQMGASFGMALKLVLNAFEYAWAPFYFQTMKAPDAKATFRLVTTYGIAGLTLLVAGLAAVGPEIVRWVLPPQFHGAARIVPWIGLARRLPRRLPADVDRPQHHQGDAATTRSRPAPPRSPASSPTSLLVPRFGSLGAAWANAAAYGVMASTAFVLSQRVYPIPLEWGRLARIGAGRDDGLRRRVGAAGDAAARRRAGPRHRRDGGVPRAVSPRSASSTRVSCGRWAGCSNGCGPGRAGPAPAAAETDVTLADEQQIP